MKIKYLFVYLLISTLTPVVVALTAPLYAFITLSFIDKKIRRTKNKITNLNVLNYFKRSKEVKK